MKPSKTKRTRLKLAGAELEGGWQSRHVVADGKWKNDSSVFSYRDASESDSYRAFCNLRSGAKFYGELVSNPLRPHELPAWIMRNNPPYSDWTCGLHVHMSVKSTGHYSRLMDTDPDPVIDKSASAWPIARIQSTSYPSFLLSTLYRWGKRARIDPTHSFWDRIEGRNRYCRVLDIDPDAQASGEESETRYRAVNYCYRKHGTVEVRVLPAFLDAKLASRAVSIVLQATELWLQCQKPRIDKISASVDIEPDIVVPQKLNVLINPHEPTTSAQLAQLLDNLPPNFDRSICSNPECPIHYPR